MNLTMLKLLQIWQIPLGPSDVDVGVVSHKQLVVYKGWSYARASSQAPIISIYNLNPTLTLVWTHPLLRSGVWAKTL